MSGIAAPAALAEIHARLAGIDGDIDYWRTHLQRPRGGPAFENEQDIHIQLNGLYELRRQWVIVLTALGVAA